MRDRKIVYSLLLTLVIGSAVTLCTSFLTGGLNRAGQVTVSLAGGTEMEGARGGAVWTGSGEETEETEPGSAKRLEEAQTYEEAPGAAPAAEEQMQESEADVQEALSPLETAAETVSANQILVVVGAEGSGEGAISAEESPYLKRLEELDAQIQKSRESQNASNSSTSSTLAKNAASNELKLWDSELNAIYNEILKHLDEEQTQKLVSAERQWMKNRDADAVEAAKNSAGGSLESVEYTASLASSTRSRAYELVSLYAAVLTEQE